MKKKILFLIPSLEIGGGAERITSLITKRLSKKYEISILTFFNLKNIYPFRGKHYSLKENAGILNRLLTFLKVQEIIRPIRINHVINSISPDLIISMTDFANQPAIIAKSIFRIKIPLIITIHGNPKKAYEKKNRHFNFLIKLLYRLNSIEKIITVSNESQDILEKEYKISRKKMHTIYNGIDLEKINKMKKNKIEIYNDFFYNDEIFKFITIGRLVPLKGHKYLIEAFSRVKKEVPNSKLFIIGDGPIKDQLKMVIQKKSLENDIFLLGLRENPFKFLANSDIFVFSSLYEGFPTVLLEAMACGLPIISTNCKTGPYEILDNGKYGLLVEILNSIDLEEKMKLLAKDSSLLRKYSDLSFQRALFFDIEKVINIWNEKIEDSIFE